MGLISEGKSTLYKVARTMSHIQTASQGKTSTFMRNIWQAIIFKILSTLAYTNIFCMHISKWLKANHAGIFSKETLRIACGLGSQVAHLCYHLHAAQRDVISTTLFIILITLDNHMVTISSFLACFLYVGSLKSKTNLHKKR